MSAFSQLAIDAGMWRTSEWAKRKGLFAEVHNSIENMDESVYRLAMSLAHANPIAMAELKKVLWKGTENWDELLKERANISGKLVLSEYTKNAIRKFIKA
jgi:methylglutaconyl-CoA hydratase